MQKGKRLGTRLFSLVLTVAMVCTMLPATVFAAEDTNGPDTNDSGVMALSANEASIGTTEYPTLQDAFAAATNGNTIKVLTGISFDTPITYSRNAVIVLDLNGQTVTYTADDRLSDTAISLSGGASLSVKDSSPASNGILETTQSNVRAINNHTGGAVAVMGGTVQTEGEISNAIANSATGQVTVTGGTVRTTGFNSCAIHNRQGAVTITGGIVESSDEDSPAIISDTGKIIIGGDAIVKSKAASTESIGTIYLSGRSTASSSIMLDIQGGRVSNNADTEGYSVYFANADITIDNLSNYYTRAATAFVGRVYPEAQAAILRDGNIFKEYPTLQDAFADALDGDTIKVLTGISFDTPITYSRNAVIVLDLNGQTVTYTANDRLSNSAINLSGGASLSVKDSSPASNGILETTQSNVRAINNHTGGAVAVMGGTVQTEGEISNAIANSATGQVTVTGGTVRTTGFNSCAIHNRQGAVTITGGIVESSDEDSPAIISDTGKITIGGDAIVKSKAASTESIGTIYLSGRSTASSSIMLDIQGGRVTNNADTEGYSVYFFDSNITIDNLSNYYTKAATAIVGRVYPERSFVPVTNITGIPTTAMVGTSTPLNGIVAPSNATNKAIQWSIVSAGTTGATITNNTLNTTAAGTVTIKATIVNGESTTTNYMQSFSIVVSTTPPPTPSSSGGGSNKSNWVPTTGTNVINTAEGQQDLTTYNNYDQLLVDGLAKINERKPGTFINLDRVVDGKVVYRIKVNPANLALVMKNDLPLGAHIAQDDADVLAVTERFAKYYSNNITALVYEQSKPLGVNAEFAAKLDLSKLNTKTLYVYSYDLTTNTYTRVNAPSFFVDANGYTHITAPLGGAIILTDKPLAAK